MRFFCVLIILFFLQQLAIAQSVDDLQKKKDKAEKEIEYTTRLLKETQKSEKSSLNKLYLLNTQIRQRNSLISNISNEMELVNSFIDNNTLAIKLLQNDLKELKEEYAEIIRLAYKNKNSGNILLFLLSANTFNQAYHRLLYFRRYTEFRQNQAKVITEIQQVLNENVKRLEQQKASKQFLADATKREKDKLSQQKGQQNNQLQKLKSQKRSLERKLKQQRKIEQQLEREIQRIIEEEARKNRASGGSGFALTPEQKLIGDNFRQNKKRLPWPVERGVIIEKFGIHKHPVLTNVQVRNNGINIATEVGAKVRAVYNGKVTKVFGISGGNTAIIIRHGEYLSVYSNLREVVVKTGDKVSTKQNIGTVYTDPDDGNKSILKFQIWRESKKMNPEEWIVK